MKDSWAEPKKGDLVYIIGSACQRVGTPGIVTSLGRGYTAIVLQTDAGYSMARDVRDLEVVTREDR